MYEPEEDYAHEEEESEEIQNELWQEACWIVISSYFEEKGNYGYFRLRFGRQFLKCRFNVFCVARQCPGNLFASNLEFITFD